MAKYIMSDFLKLMDDFKFCQVPIEEFKQKFFDMMEEEKVEYSDDEKNILMELYEDALNGGEQ